MKKYVTFFVSEILNYLNSSIRIKYLVIFLLFLGNTFVCYSNNILWERLPSGNNEYIPYYENPDCVISSDNKYIITINTNAANNNWIVVYDKINGNLVNKLLFQIYEPMKQKNIVEIFSRKDSNIVCCIYHNQGKDTSFFNARFYEVPSLKLIDSVGRFGLPENLSSDFHFQVSLPLTNSKKFYYIDNHSQIIIFTDSIKDDSGLALNIKTIKFSPDNNFLIIQTYFQSNVYIYDIKKREIIWQDDIEDEDTEYKISISDISIDMKYLAFCSSENIYIFDFPTKELLNVINLENFSLFSPANISVSNNNQFLLITNNTQFAIFDLLKNSIIINSSLSDYIKNIPGINNYTYDYFYKQFFTHDDKNILLSSYSGQYYFNFNSNKLEELFSTHLGNSFDGYTGILMFANNDEYLLTIGPDKTLIWDAKTGKFVKMLTLALNSEQINQVSLSADKKQLVYKSGNKIYFYNFVDEGLAVEIEVNSTVLQISVSTNGKYLGYTMVDSSFAIYDLEAGKVVYSKKENFTGYHENNIRFYSISLSLNNLCAVTLTGGDKWVGISYYTKIYDFIEDKQINLYLNWDPVEFVNSDSLILEWSPNSNPVNLLKYSDEKNRYLPLKEYYQEGITSLAISKDGTHFITTGPTIWNIETGDSIQLHADPELNDMDYVAVSDNGKMLAAISPEGRIVVWDVEKYLTPVEEKPIPQKNVLSIYPNPASGDINLRYRIETAGLVNIFLTDILGNQTLLKSEYKFPGEYVVTFNLNIYPQGIYNINLITDGKQFSNKFLLLK